MSASRFLRPSRLLRSTNITLASVIPSIFLPTSVSGCKLWLRADLGITLNAGNVSLWADQSGNGHNASESTGAKQPAYFASGGALGQAYTLWTENSAQILLGTLSISTPFSYYIVCDYDGTGTNSYGFDLGGNTNALQCAGTSNQFNVGVTASTVAFSGLSPNTPYAVLFKGSVGSSTSVIHGFAPQSNASPPTSPMTQFSVGSYTGDLGVVGWGGKIYEVIVYDHVMTAPEDAQLQAYLTARYGT